MLELLGDGGWHSTLEFIEPPLRILKPASRAHDLRRQGFAIEVRRRGGRSTIWEYRLASPPLPVAVVGGFVKPRRKSAARPIDECARCGERAELVDDEQLYCASCAIAERAA
jgi:hypothetical protein